MLIISLPIHRMIYWHIVWVQVSTFWCIQGIRKGMCVCLGLHICEHMLGCTRLLCAMWVMTTADATTCMFSTCSGGSWVESPDTLIHEVLFLKQRGAEQLRISVLSGRGRSGVVAGSRSVGEEQLQQTWQRWDGGEEKGRSKWGENKTGSVRRFSRGSRKQVVFI